MPKVIVICVTPVPRTYELLWGCWPERKLGIPGGIQTMLDFWKQSENNDRFSLIVLGVCLIVLVSVVVTRL